jgi:hypothetical protein
MKKFLSNLSNELLLRIARDYSLGEESRERQIAGLCGLFADYRLSVADVRSRYSI